MAHQFHDTQFISAKEKATILAVWIRFLKSGLRFERFTKALYHHLIQHCSFIAHYSRAGFYSHYFERGDSVVLFLSQFDSRGPCLSVEYGERYWLSGDCEDLNRAMIAEATKFLPELQFAASRRQQAADITAAAGLLAKHGLRYELSESRNDQSSSNAQTHSQTSLFSGDEPSA